MRRVPGVGIPPAVGLFRLLTFEICLHDLEERVVLEFPWRIDNGHGDELLVERWKHDVARGLTSSMKREARLGNSALGTGATAAKIFLFSLFSYKSDETDQGCKAS